MEWRIKGNGKEMSDAQDGSAGDQCQDTPLDFGRLYFHYPDVDDFCDQMEISLHAAYTHPIAFRLSYLPHDLLNLLACKFPHPDFDGVQGGLSQV